MAINYEPDRRIPGQRAKLNSPVRTRQAWRREELRRELAGEPEPAPTISQQTALDNRAAQISAFVRGMI